MYVRGMFNQNIYEEMQGLYGVRVTSDMVTAVTDKVIPEIREWQKRQLEEQYAIVFRRCNIFQCKARWNSNEEIALGVTMGGEKERFYIGDAESAKYWCNILNELRNRGVKGLKDAIGNISTMTEFQRCIVHIIRNTLQYVSYSNLMFRKEQFILLT